MRSVLLRSSLPARVLTLSVAVSLLFVQGSQLAHEAFVKHAVCAEHGELTHEEATEAGVAQGPARPLDLHASLRNALSGTTGGSRHEHCLFARCERFRTPAPARVDSVVTPVPERTPSPPLSSSLHTRARTFRLAPKQSPPGVA